MGDDPRSTRAALAAGLWDLAVALIDLYARDLGMPDYLVDITESRGRERSAALDISPITALRVEWDRTMVWWIDGWHDAAAEAGHTS